ncbi:MAG: hypothetical protein HZB62_04345 [Nitrospirae bacterium]|nr:hypothetical protein [Nitrospirota bacterium]
MKISGLRFLVLPFILVCFAVGVEAAQKQSAVAKDESLRKGETRVTLAPELFNDARVKEAYRVAKEIPWVLDSIYCFCMCKESPTFRHKSLLSCYVDNHASV